MFCGLLQCLEDGRPFVLMFGAFCGGCQFADVIAEDYRPPDQPMSKMNELVLDTVTALFYILGSYSVYNKDKQFTNPVMRFGLLLILFRIIDVRTRLPSGCSLSANLWRSTSSSRAPFGCR